MKIYKPFRYNFKTSAIEYREINDDNDDFEIIEDAQQVFKDSGIRTNLGKNITDIVLDDGTVIGTTASEWSISDNIATFSFDIAISEKFRGRKIGTNLIIRAIDKYNSEKRDYQDAIGKTEMELYVVNARLSDFLVRQFGFEIIQKLPDSTILKKV